GASEQRERASPAHADQCSRTVCLDAVDLPPSNKLVRDRVDSRQELFPAAERQFVVPRHDKNVGLIARNRGLLQLAIESVHRPGAPASTGISEYVAAGETDVLG